MPKTRVVREVYYTPDELREALHLSGNDRFVVRCGGKEYGQFIIVSEHVLDDNEISYRDRLIERKEKYSQEEAEKRLEHQ